MAARAKTLVRQRKRFAVLDNKKSRSRLKVQDLQLTKQTALVKQSTIFYVIRAYCPSKNKYAYFCKQTNSSKIVWDINKARHFKYRSHATRAMQSLHQKGNLQDYLLNPLDDLQIAVIRVTLQEVH